MLLPGRVVAMSTCCIAVSGIMALNYGVSVVVMFSNMAGGNELKGIGCVGFGNMETRLIRPMGHGSHFHELLKSDGGGVTIAAGGALEAAAVVVGVVGARTHTTQPHGGDRASEQPPERATVRPCDRAATVR